MPVNREKYFQSEARAHSLAFGLMNNLSKIKEQYGEERWAHEFGRHFAGCISQIENFEVGLSEIESLRLMESELVRLQGNHPLLTHFAEGMLDELNRQGVLETDRRPEDIKAQVPE